ncbi:UNVERIFIED_CONTAM: hypothetical protein Sradi_2525600 [Sesamum radiatum]|uniref:Uncharacterized protein n=1 Tax=Sesamum radiatum TaxID=300843 RepID=A0AAW2SKN6_SESRA
MLFVVYCYDSYTAVSLWDELDRNYNTEEQGLEKYSISKFMWYQMVEDKSVAQQTHEIINLEHALADAKMKLPEKFLVMSIVDKFPKSWHGVNTIVEFRDVVFLEDVFPTKIGLLSSVSLDDSLASTSIPEHVEKMSNVGVNPSRTSLNHEESDEPRWSKRARIVKDFGSDFVTYNIEEDPVTFKDAMDSLEAKQWKEVVKSEMDFIVSKGTRVLVDLPPRCTTIGSKWIFKKKLKFGETVDKFKANWWLKVLNKRREYTISIPILR